MFDTILDKCGLHCEGATAMEPMKLNAHKQPTAMTMSQQVRQTHTSAGVTACDPNELITIVCMCWHKPILKYKHRTVFNRLFCCGNILIDNTSLGLIFTECGG